jgi:hypothetical protein
MGANAMKKIIMAATLTALAFLAGCASLTYEAADGSKVTYSRFLTGSDSIKGNLPGASIESTGQQAIDPAVLEAVIKIMSTAK